MNNEVVETQFLTWGSYNLQRLYNNSGAHAPIGGRQDIAQSVQWHNYTLDDPRFVSLQRREICLLSESSRLVLGPFILVFNGHWGTYLGVKRQAGDVMPAN